MKIGTTNLRAGGEAGTSSGASRDRKSTRLNSSHSQISYAVFCLKKKKNNSHNIPRPTYRRSHLTHPILRFRRTHTTDHTHIRRYSVFLHSVVSSLLVLLLDIIR